MFNGEHRKFLENSLLINENWQKTKLTDRNHKQNKQVILIQYKTIATYQSEHLSILIRFTKIRNI